MHGITAQLVEKDGQKVLKVRVPRKCDILEDVVYKLMEAHGLAESGVPTKAREALYYIDLSMELLKRAKGRLKAKARRAGP